MDLQCGSQQELPIKSEAINWGTVGKRVTKHIASELRFKNAPGSDRELDDLLYEVFLELFSTYTRRFDPINIPDLSLEDAVTYFLLTIAKRNLAGGD